MSTVTISGIERGPWSREWSPSINPTEPDGYEIVPLESSVRLYCCSQKSYAGWLAKHVEPMFIPASKIRFSYTLTTDAATYQAQITAETDTKFTDANGWTYDGSAQWKNTPKGLMFQVGNPWQDTNVIVVPPKPNVPVRVLIDYELDYQKHALTIAAVTWADAITVPLGITIPAKQSGWAKSEIVTQLQQCTGPKGGAYAIEFSEISYQM